MHTTVVDAQSRRHIDAGTSNQGLDSALRDALIDLAYVTRLSRNPLVLRLPLTGFHASGDARLYAAGHALRRLIQTAAGHFAQHDPANTWLPAWIALRLRFPEASQHVLAVHLAYDESAIRSKMRIARTWILDWASRA